MQDQDNKEIWRDERTGLPMHRHTSSEPYTSNGIVFYSEGELKHKPCDCKCSVFDIPLSAVSTQKES